MHARLSIFVLVLAAALPGAAASPAGPTGPGAGEPYPATPRGPSPTRVGAIEGRVQLPRQPARRTAERYPAPGAAAPERVQPISAVVFLRGRVPGVTFRGQTATLAQEDTMFTPSALVVAPGTTVAFPNRDPFFHNVFSYSAAQRFDLGRYPRGESKSVRFHEPGIVRIYCEVHETMRSVVIVSENPFFAVLDETGEFTMRDVPEGRYELEVWHPDRRGRTVPVEVVAGRTVRVDLRL